MPTCCRKSLHPRHQITRNQEIVNGIRVRCETEQAGQLRAIDWSEAFEGIKTHEPNYGIVIHGIPIDELDLDDPKTIKLLEATNGFSSRIISKITFLRCNDKRNTALL